MSDVTETKPSLLEAVRLAVRARFYSYRTEQTYVYWIRQYLRFHRMRHPREMGEEQVADYLTWLAVEREVSQSTQNLALNSLLFLHKHVLEQPLGELPRVVRARKQIRLPVVLSVDEVGALLSHLDGMHWMVAGVLYGAGLRLREALGLRVKDLDFAHRAIIVRHGKGGKDRIVTLADELIEPLQNQLRTRRSEHKRDLGRGVGEVWMPAALARKYPNAPLEFAWQFVFAASRPGPDPRSGVVRRHHIHASAVQKAIKRAARRAAKAGNLPHLAPFLCNASSRTGHGYPHGTRAIGPFGSPHHADLHARAAAWRTRGAQPIRRGVDSPADLICLSAREQANRSSSYA
ncbi:MAG: integron integrase [Gammaproteobacteria bacterium]|jgi:integron integrase